MSSIVVSLWQLQFGTGILPEFDVEFTQSLTTTTAKDTLDVLPIMLALNFHVVNTEKLDFWLGPQIGYVMWNDPLTFTASGQPDFVLETEDTFGLGLVLGLDWWLTKSSGLNCCEPIV